MVELTASGGFLWGKGMGGTGHDFAADVAIDSAGNVLTTGGFGQGGAGVSADFDPGSGQANLTSAGAHDLFVSQLSSAGNYLWAGRVGSTGEDHGNGVGTDAAGNVYTTGRFVGTADFNPGAGTYNLTSANHSNGVPSDDVFVLKLLPAGALQAAGGAAPGMAARPNLALPQAEPLLAEALARWQAVGADVSRRGSIDLRIADKGFMPDSH